LLFRVGLLEVPLRKLEGVAEKDETELTANCLVKCFVVFHDENFGELGTLGLSGLVPFDNVSHRLGSPSALLWRVEDFNL